MLNNLYWNKLWPSKYSNKAKWRNLFFQGNFEMINNRPTCSKCNNHKWYPKMFGSIDVGYELIYVCDCGASMTKITCAEEGNI